MNSPNIGLPRFIEGDMSINFMKPNNLSCECSTFLQSNRKTQLLATATWLTIVSGALVDHVFYNHFFNNPDCGIFDDGVTDNCANFVKLPASCRNFDDFETTFKVFHFIFNKKARQVYYNFFFNWTENALPLWWHWFSIWSVFTTHTKSYWSMQLCEKMRKNTTTWV